MVFELNNVVLIGVADRVSASGTKYVTISVSDGSDFMRCIFADYKDGEACLNLPLYKPYNLSLTYNFARKEFYCIGVEAVPDGK